AGTARAARIAIIAITTSNSISVNAEMIFLIFIVGFMFCGCSEGFLRGLFWGLCLRFLCFVLGFRGVLVEVRLIAGFKNEVNNYLLLFLGAQTTRLKYGATAARQFAAVSMRFLVRGSP